jgi:type IV pilus assembly protein PilM
MSSTLSTSKPKVACEIASDRVVAGRISERGTIADCTSSDLPTGVVDPDLTETNLRDRNAVYRVLHDTLDSVSGKASDVIAILPDAAVRVVLLDFEALPHNRGEAEAIVRFRLKKSLPFDVDKAKVSYHAQPSATGVRVVAAVVLATVLEEYESVFREAGYNPGIVLPSTLAALGAASGQRPTLIVKVDAHTTSIAILAEQQLLLFRTLENQSGIAISGEKLAEEVYPSVVFFQDTYHLNIDEIYVAGLPRASQASPALETQTGAEVRDFLLAVPPEQIAGSTPNWRMAGVLGALIS